MTGKHKEELRSLRQMPLKDLYGRVQDLRNSILHLEARLRGDTTIGGGAARVAYSKGFKGNLREAHRSLARAKTVLLERQREVRS